MLGRLEPVEPLINTTSRLPRDHDRRPVPANGVRWIDDLGETGYAVLQSIPVVVKTVGVSDYEASCHDANMAISGSDSSDARQSLVAETPDTFDVLQTVGFPDTNCRTRTL